MTGYQKKYQEFKESGKNLYDFFGDWLKEAMSLALRRGVVMELETEVVSFPWTDPARFGDPGYIRYHIRSNYFPGAVVPDIGLGAIVERDGSTEKLEEWLLYVLSYQSGIAVPPVFSPPPEPDPKVDSPIGTRFGGGLFAAAPGYDHSSVTETYTDATGSYRKFERDTPFGVARWYQQI